MGKPSLKRQKLGRGMSRADVTWLSTQEQHVQRARGSSSQEPQEAGVHAVHRVQGESEGTSSGLECSGSHGAVQATHGLGLLV